MYNRDNITIFLDQRQTVYVDNTSVAAVGLVTAIISSFMHILILDSIPNGSEL